MTDLERLKLLTEELDAPGGNTETGCGCMSPPASARMYTDAQLAMLLELHGAAGSARLLAGQSAECAPEQNETGRKGGRHMMSGFAMRQAEATFRRALAAYGAACVPVWRVQRDANGVPIGGAQKVGCVYGVRYERGQTANVLVDIPGVIARMDAPRLCCALGDTARSLQEGDGLTITGRWYTVLRADVQMGILCDVVLKEGEPDGIEN